MQIYVVKTAEATDYARATTRVRPSPHLELANAILAHLGARCFSPATVRAYAYDLLNFLRFLSQR